MTSKAREARGTWPIAMACADCGSPSARIYPYPIFEDCDDFEAGTEECRNGRTIGTLWCPNCSPFWGEFLLQQMTILRIRERSNDPRATEPAMPLLGGFVPEVFDLEAILMDFTESVGPIVVIGEPRPHAKKGEAFVWACADLVAAMRDAALIGLIYWRDDAWSTTGSPTAVVA